MKKNRAENGHMRVMRAGQGGGYSEQGSLGIPSWYVASQRETCVLEGVSLVHSWERAI